MKKILGFIIAAGAVLLCTASCSDPLKDGVVDLTPNEKPDDNQEQEFTYPSSYEFNHPCALVTKEDIQRVKASIASASESDPVYVAYKNFCTNTYSQPSHKATPVEVIVRGDPTGTGVSGENYITISKDASVAYQLALRWKLTDDSQYAAAAVAILNEWADVCKKIDANDANQFLCAGFQGYTLGNAAELLRDYEGWTSQDQADFKTWLRNVWVSKNITFIDEKGGPNNCPLHCWSNWELCNMASLMAIGIYLEDVDLITKVYRNFREGEGSGALNKMIPYDAIPDPDGHGMIAQSMESGRDQGHATLVISICAELCQMAWNVGIDFWGMEDNKVLAMSQYTAKWNAKPYGTYLCTSMPFTTYYYCPEGCGCRNPKDHGAVHTAVSNDEGRGKLRPCWDLVYSHYKHVKKCSDDEVYYVKLFADQLRYVNGVLTGDGGSGDSRYGSNSSAFDQIGWGTMMYYRGE